ncbi:hypothetical protein SEA_BEUFFERT_238 [Streptomyces phage Beuffert]|nr:hypothetical protein SEA_BEUFFERT_238 [Streptomyces phage Beuffert]
MRRSTSCAFVGGLNFGSAVVNFVEMVHNLAIEDSFAFVNMFYVFLGLVLGMILMDMSKDAAASGN